jgi:hypothetical protein
MVESNLIPAIKEAVKQNEIGNQSPYKLSYARLGVSGASFGVFQGDTNVSDTARQTLRKALQADGASDTTIARIMSLVSQRLPNGNPLSPDDTEIADTALSSETGRALVDAMDNGLFMIVIRDLNACTAAAQTNHCSIEPIALLYMAVWVNMTGPPTILTKFLAGNSEIGVLPPVGPTVTTQDMQTYLHASRYFILHPRNFLHLQESVETAEALLPHAFEV